MEKSELLIKDIKQIDKRGQNLLKEDNENAERLIDEIIELPLRNACKIFREKGIRTLMSSANEINVLKEGEKPTEKEDVYGSCQQYSKDRPTYEEAGKGYAWIMLDFDTLSDENKDFLFSLEERKGKNGEKIGEKAIWFLHPCEIGNIEFQLRAGILDYDLLKEIMPEKEIPQNIQVDKRLAEFEKRHIVLAYHWGMYPLQTVILRMPVNQESTVEEVESYFSKFAESFRSQVVEIEKEDVEEPEQ